MKKANYENLSIEAKSTLEMVENTILIVLAFSMFLVVASFIAIYQIVVPLDISADWPAMIGVLFLIVLPILVVYKKYGRPFFRHCLGIRSEVLNNQITVSLYCNGIAVPNRWKNDGVESRYYFLSSHDPNIEMQCHMHLAFRALPELFKTKLGKQSEPFEIQLFFKSNESKQNVVETLLGNNSILKQDWELVVMYVPKADKILWIQNKKVTVDSFGKPMKN